MAELLRPENRGIRLVEAGAEYTVDQHGHGDLFFATEKKHPHETQDLFLSVRMTGLRLEKEPWLKQWSGLTIMDNAPIVGDFETMLNEHKNLFHIAVETEPGFAWSGKLLRCDMHIEGFETYYTSIMDTLDPGTEDSISMADLWRSSDPNDLNEYRFMASPNDTTLLSRLQFSFHVVPAGDSDITR